MTKSMKKKMPRTFAELQKGGWTLASKRNHLKFRHASGAQVTIPQTPSDSRSDMNAAAQIRRSLKGTHADN
jgi:predicted RNA binding protein YcfA (HicA-like mRNA interferase family)